MKKTILVADDEYAIRELVELTLEEDYIVIKAEDGEEALEKANNGATRPDLIILDVMMPKIDGFQVCKKLKSSEKTKKIPIIMLTVKNTPEDLKKAISYNVDEFITKPFEPEIIEKRVNSYFTNEKQKGKLSRMDRSIHYIKDQDS